MTRSQDNEASLEYFNNSENYYVKKSLEDASFSKNDFKSASFNRINFDHSQTNLNESQILQSHSPRLPRYQQKRISFPKLSLTYDKPKSDREGWWRSTIKETPKPGAYDIPSFLNDLKKRPNTYRFKTEGRKRDPAMRSKKGDYLLPGAYDFEDLTDRLRKTRVTYGFKNAFVRDIINSSSASDITCDPGSYDTAKYGSVDGSVELIKHSFFKSKTKREFIYPKQGPAPGEYDPSLIDKKAPITSPFKSVSRSANSIKAMNTPGPGAYDPISVWVESKQSETFSNKGIFFTPSTKVYN